MKMMKWVIFGYVGCLLYVVACAIPGAGDVHLAACTRACTETNAQCLEDSNVCFDQLEKCFDEANECRKSCDDCVMLGSCVDESDCESSCSEQGETCIEYINDCLGMKEKCFLNVQSCFSDCIAEVEDLLKN